jgi:hypothetical protein
MIPIAITLTISLILSIMWANGIEKNSMTKKERDEMPFP